MGAPRISVAICTLNRCALLVQALESLGTQTLARDQFEIIVVDNGSTDGTADAVRVLEPKLGPIHYRLEPKPGLSRARNVALAQARSPLLAFLDDDAVAGPTWVEGVLRGFENHSRAACVGGPVEPVWEKSPPSWISASALEALTVVELGPSPLRVEPPRFIAGANFAVRVSELREQGGFPEFLGRQGTTLLSGEEIFVCDRFRERGLEVWYEPQARVSHWVPAARVTEGWLLRRNFWQGVSAVVSNRALGRLGFLARLLRIPKLILGAIVWPSELLGFLQPLGAVGALDRRCAAARRLGQLRGLLEPITIAKDRP